MTDLVSLFSPTKKTNNQELEALKFSEEDVGKRCKVKGQDSEGTIRFVGRHHKNNSPKCGVEFDEAVEKGKAGKFAGVSQNGEPSLRLRL